jgi:hypothetical protein
MYRLIKKPPVLKPIVVPFNKIQLQRVNSYNIFNTHKFNFPPLKIITVCAI